GHAAHTTGATAARCTETAQAGDDRPRPPDAPGYLATGEKAGADDGSGTATAYVDAEAGAGEDCSAAKRIGRRFMGNRGGTPLWQGVDAASLVCQTERLTQHVARCNAIAGRDTSGYFRFARTTVVREILSRSGIFPVTLGGRKTT